MRKILFYHFLLFVILTNYSFAVGDCTYVCPAGKEWTYSSATEPESFFTSGLTPADSWSCGGTTFSKLYDYTETDNSGGYRYYDKQITTYTCQVPLDCVSPNVETVDENGGLICSEPPPPECPANSSWDTVAESCRCDAPYQSEYNLDGLICVMPDCPPTYGNTVPPLPLFLQTDNVNNCNFFALGDGAVLDLDGLVCCYGQQDTSEPLPCGLNEIALNGECYPIVPREEDPPPDTSCPKGSYWSIASESCVEWFPENNSTNPDGSPTATAGDTDGDGSLNDIGQDGSYEGDGDYGIDMDGAESALSDILTSYVLIDLPVSISSNCGDEFKKTFTLPVTGQSYSIDVAQHISTIEEYAPMIKAIILFMFSLSGVLIVLSGNKE